MNQSTEQPAGKQRLGRAARAKRVRTIEGGRFGLSLAAWRRRRIRILIGVHLVGWMMVQSVVFGFCPVSLQTATALVSTSVCFEEEGRETKENQRHLAQNQSINQVEREARIN